MVQIRLPFCPCLHPPVLLLLLLLLLLFLTHHPLYSRHPASATALSFFLSFFVMYTHPTQRIEKEEGKKERNELLLLLYGHRVRTIMCLQRANWCPCSCWIDPLLVPSLAALCLSIVNTLVGVASFLPSSICSTANGTFTRRKRRRCSKYTHIKYGTTLFFLFFGRLNNPAGGRTGGKARRRGTFLLIGHCTWFLSYSSSFFFLNRFATFSIYD